MADPDPVSRERSGNRIGYPRMKASGESSTTKHRLLHASGPHPIPPPNDPNTTKTSDLSTRQMVTTWKVRTRVVDRSPGHYPSACSEHHNGSVDGGPVMVPGEEGGGSTAWSSQRHGGRNHRAAHDCFIACVDRAMQAMVRAVDRPRGTAEPGGGPASGAPSKGGRNRSDEGLVVVCVGGDG
ncbi:hypothetical protein F511_20789 [Dorcoceras hygrometricum]|uniref:Uncharacterized protein n=1 Tax=Dorcoceras hygrometricum TaxID=472368 RepID=A0A2Z7CYA5_9LAMI|nr:hypothetical protein F511_20789 [Dorcoceras hygrometricum]